MTSLQASTPGTNSRALNALLVYIFFMATGFTVVMPLVAVHFVDNLGMAAATVGLALGVRQLIQQGLAMFGGGLADRFGARGIVCAGVLLRATGFAVLAFAADLPLLFAAMLFIALGGSLFEPAYQAAIAALTTPQNRTRYLSLGNTVSGVAYTTGPLLGVWLLRFDFAMVCAAAAACFLVTFAIATTLPKVATTSAPVAIKEGLDLVRRDRRFLLLTVLLIGYWFTAVQLNISFALLATQLTGTAASVGTIFALNAGMTAVLQYPVIRWLEPHLAATRILVLGVVIMALGAGAIAFASNFTLFLACIAIFSLGTLLARPTQQSLLLSMANQHAVGTFIGFSSLGLAIGGGLGNVAGGWLIDVANAWRWRPLPSLVFCAVSLLTALGIYILTRQRAEPSAKLHGESIT